MRASRATNNSLSTCRPSSGATIADGQGIGTINNDDAVTSDVVISQVYGGGGNSGATLNPRLHRAVQSRHVDDQPRGWSVQYRRRRERRVVGHAADGSIAPGHVLPGSRAQAPAARRRCRPRTPPARSRWRRAWARSRFCRRPQPQLVSARRSASRRIWSATARRIAMKARVPRRHRATRPRRSASAAAASTRTTTTSTSQ